MKTLQLFLISTLAFFLFSCSDDDNNRPTRKSSKKEILSFKIEEQSATINESDKSITLTLRPGSAVDKLRPVIEISEGAIITPGSEEEQDFSNPVIYTVQAEDGSRKQYTVTIGKRKSTEARILIFSINGVKGKIRDNYTSLTPVGANSILVKLNGVTDVTRLKPSIEIEGATVSPASDSEMDFSRPVTYTVTAESGRISTYTVGVQYDTYPSGLQYPISIRNTNRTQNVTTHYKFGYNPLSKLSGFINTTKPFYMEDELIDGEVVNIKYGEKGKIAQLIFEERVDLAVASTRTLNVSYPDSKTVHVTDGINQDIIILNESGKVAKFETKDRTEFFVYDDSDNLIEHTVSGQGYKRIAYDEYNGTFTYFNAPQWTLLYTMENLIGTGLNNPISIDTYGEDGMLVETITYEYKYDKYTRYPRSYTYQAGGEEFKGLLSFNYVFPYSLNLKLN